MYYNEKYLLKILDGIFEDIYFETVLDIGHHPMRNFEKPQYLTTQYIM